MHCIFSALSLALLFPLTIAQFPPKPSGLTNVESKVDPRVTISFKETQVCEKSPGVKSYSGYVHLPGSILSNVGGFNINTYFIYFEARNNPKTAPLGIYLAGGPGESSTYAALASESGPCYVNIDGTDTINNTWSFNNNVNMLYIDQPVQVGFSYDKLVNATFDLLAGDVVTPANIQASSLPPVNASVGYGTFASQDTSRTANNTVQAGKALWHFAEHWLSSFPQYKTSSKKIGIWGNSYGGYWVPETAVQYSKHLSNLPAKHALKSKNLVIDNIGITNGCVDTITGAVGYPEYAYNNTYGVKFASHQLYQDVMHNLTKPGGCLDLTKQCRALGEEGDPDFTGRNATVNELCMGAFGYCEQYVIGAFPKLNNISAFDIATPNPSPCPYYLPVRTYLANATVQASLGVPLNFTYDSNAVTAAFGLLPSLPITAQSADLIRQDGLSNIEYLLAHNVSVAFVFGDRDYRCPWTGGIATALAAKWSHQSHFAAAGYEELVGLKTSEHGAVVKQYGRLSFSRIFDAGHSVSAYAPETVYRVFERTRKRVDVVTGSVSSVGYASGGPRESWGWRNRLPRDLPPTCMVEGSWTKSNPWAGVVGGGS